MCGNVLGPGRRRRGVDGSGRLTDGPVDATSVPRAERQQERSAGPATAGTEATSTVENTRLY